MVVQACNLSTWEIETGKSGVQVEVRPGWYEFKDYLGNLKPHLSKNKNQPSGGRHYLGLETESHGRGAARGAGTMRLCAQIWAG